MVRKKKIATGRKANGRNKGFWYRTGRGWYATNGQAKIPLLDNQGNHLKSKDTPLADLEQSHARYLLGLQEQSQRLATGDTALVLKVVQDYLDHAKAENRASTYNKRGEYLFDFCFGLPARFWDYGNGRKVAKPTKANRIHNGYGKRLVGEIIPMDIQQWLDKHPTWGKGTRRIAVQGLKRAFNYAVEMGLIKHNPIKGYKIGQGNKRITYFTPEQEQALYDYSFNALRIVIKVAIRTGARYGCELATLTAKHIEETPKGMVWRWSKEESKTTKGRIIYVPKDIADIVRPLIKLHPTGKIFRNQHGEAWTQATLRRAFLRLKDKLKKNGIKLDEDACFYSCRHTFAKRTLGGYWTGKPATIEQVAGAMGNSRQIAWEHYGKDCEAYTDPIWDCVG